MTQAQDNPPFFQALSMVKNVGWYVLLYFFNNIYYRKMACIIDFEKFNK